MTKSTDSPEKLAARRHLHKTDAVKLALEYELRRLEDAVPFAREFGHRGNGSWPVHRQGWRRTWPSMTNSAVTPDVHSGVSHCRDAHGWTGGQRPRGQVRSPITITEACLCCSRPSSARPIWWFPG